MCVWQPLVQDTLLQARRGEYDFFYLPIDFKNLCNLGYAFVNLVTREAAQRLYHSLHLKKWRRFNSKKVQPPGLGLLQLSSIGGLS